MTTGISLFLLEIKALLRQESDQVIPDSISALCSTCSSSVSFRTNSVRHTITHRPSCSEALPFSTSNRNLLGSHHFHLFDTLRGASTFMPPLIEHPSPCIYIMAFSFPSALCSSYRHLITWPFHPLYLKCHFCFLPVSISPYPALIFLQRNFTTWYLFTCLFIFLIPLEGNLLESGEFVCSIYECVPSPVPRMVSGQSRHSGSIYGRRKGVIHLWTCYKASLPT